MKSIFKSLIAAIEDWQWERIDRKLERRLRAPLTKRYLAEQLPEEEFSILERCLERLNLKYGNLFWFCDDITVHNQMKLRAEDKGFSSIEEVFINEEIDVILSAERLLDWAPVNVHEELRVFCHF